LARVARGLLFALATVALLLAAGAVVPRPFLAEHGAGPANRRILAIANPIHTDIVVPLDPDVRARFDPLVRAGIKADTPGARYLVFGWGSRAFYIETPTWADLKVEPLLSALTLDASVMHVSVAGAVDEAQPSVRRFGLTDAQLDRLLDFIDDSLQIGPNGPIWIADAAYGEFDGFFEAKGNFTAFLGCNTWAAAALRRAGVQTGWWNPLPQTLGLSLDLHN
jgi:uncharacterized protein (TIGR02117 family)